MALLVRVGRRPPRTAATGHAPTAHPTSESSLPVPAVCCLFYFSLSDCDESLFGHEYHGRRVSVAQAEMLSKVKIHFREVFLACFVHG